MEIYHILSTTGPLNMLVPKLATSSVLHCLGYSSTISPQKSLPQESLCLTTILCARPTFKIPYVIPFFPTYAASNLIFMIEHYHESFKKTELIPSYMQSYTRTKSNTLERHSTRLPIQQGKYH